MYHKESSMQTLNLHQFCTWVALWVPALKLRFFEPLCVTSSSGGTRGEKSWNSIMHEDECYVGKPQSTLMYLFDLLSNRLPGHNPKHPWGGQTLSFPLLLFHMWRHSWVKCLFYGLQCLKSPTWGEGLKRVVIFIYFILFTFFGKIVNWLQYKSYPIWSVSLFSYFKAN